MTIVVSNEFTPDGSAIRVVEGVLNLINPASFSTNDNYLLQAACSSEVNYMLINLIQSGNILVKLLMCVGRSQCTSMNYCCNIDYSKLFSTGLEL